MWTGRIKALHVDGQETNIQQKIPSQLQAKAKKIIRLVDL